MVSANVAALLENAPELAPAKNTPLQSRKGRRSFSTQKGLPILTQPWEKDGDSPLSTGAHLHLPPHPAPAHRAEQQASSSYSAALGSAFGKLRADPDDQECQILGDCFGYAMQGLLAAICSAALLTKWYLEVPRRWFSVFLLDVSKQVIGALWYHLLNMVVATYLGEEVGAGLGADECAWYFINFMVDTTAGLFFNVIFVRMSESWIGYESGEYWNEGEGDPSQLDKGKWFYQMSIYLGIVTLSKACVLMMILMFLPFWAHIGTVGTTWIEDVQTRLFFVMVLVPAVMDTMFFCTIDEVIKAKPEGRAPSKQRAGDAKK